MTVSLPLLHVGRTGCGGCGEAVLLNLGLEDEQVRLAVV